MVDERRLPSHLEDLQAEVEGLAGAPVRWEFSQDLSGAMCAAIEDGPVIRFREFSEGGAAEELMHLKLGFSGFPRISYLSSLPWVKDVATMLQNVVQHHMFYPQLEKWGYEPTQTECQGIKKQLDVLESFDLSRLQREPHFQASFAMVFVRTKLDCRNDDVSARLDAIFSREELKRARTVGEEVISTVRQHVGNSPVEYRTTVEKCLSKLGVRDKVTFERPPGSKSGV